MNKNQFIEVSKWQKETFGQATARSKVAHLMDEVEELADELNSDSEDNNSLRMEFADCFLLLFGAAAATGMSYEDIEQCISDKMVINRARKWGKPDANGVVNHIKEAA